jgi:ATP-dependent protease ClpP protease subunit
MEHIIKLKGVVGLEILPLQIQDQISSLKSGPKDTIRFEVNSPGGSVPDGFEIYNTIKNTEAKTKIFEVTGIAMSIMSLIIMAGDEIEASEISMLMIHKAATGLEGNSDELKKQADILNKIDEILVELYYKRNQAKGKTKLKREEIMDMLAAETWLTPQEAMEYGFVDRIVNKTDYKVAAQAKDLIFNDKSKMKHLDRLRKLLALGGRPEIKPELVKDQLLKALGQRKYVDLSDEEAAALAETIKGAIKETVGAETLTEEEVSQVEALLTTAVNELKAKEEVEAAEETEEEKKKREEEEKKKEEEMNAKFQEQDEINKEIADALLKNAEMMEGLKTEITNLQRGVRTFGKKPIVNETTRINMGATYVDPYAKHRQEMAEIEARTRNSKRGTPPKNKA